MDDPRDLSLLETLDHLLDRGVVLSGEAVISIGDVDLLYLGLNIVLANVDAIIRTSQPKKAKPASQSPIFPLKPIPD